MIKVVLINRGSINWIMRQPYHGIPSRYVSKNETELNEEMWSYFTHIHICVIHISVYISKGTIQAVKHGIFDERRKVNFYFLCCTCGRNIWLSFTVHVLLHFPIQLGGILWLVPVLELWAEWHTSVSVWDTWSHEFSKQLPQKGSSLDH